MLRRPTRETLIVYVTQTVLLTILFSIVYGTTNYLAQTATATYHLWTSQELAIPFVPEFIFVYVSINLLTLVPLFVLNAHQLKALAGSFAVAIFGAGLVFYFFPAPIGWARPTTVAHYDFFFRTLYMLDKAANTFPSLHITFGYLCVRILISAEPRLRAIWFWFAMIALSVLLTHQHHLIDIFGGMVLGEACFRWVYLRLARRAPSDVNRSLNPTATPASPFRPD